MNSPREPATSPDAELLLEVRRGTPEAVDAYFRAEHPRVFRLCFGLLADEAEAEDAAQEAMLKLLDRLPTWDPDRSYPAWRHAVVTNLCRDRLRRAASRRRAEVDFAEERPQAVLPDPGDPSAREEVLEVLRRALAVLSPREREVFCLRELEGQATAETAEALGITVSSVRSLLTLARRRLREHLGPRLQACLGGGE